MMICMDFTMKRRTLTNFSYATTAEPPVSTVVGEVVRARNPRMDGFMRHIHKSEKFTLEASHAALMSAKEKAKAHA
jgi:hypothetical protein